MTLAVFLPYFLGHCMNDKIYNTAANKQVIEMLPSRMDTALDIGCGTGRLCQVLGRIAGSVDGVTYSQQERELAAQHCRNVWLHNIDNGLPTEASMYDVVVLSHVMEHIANPKRLMEGIQRVTHRHSVIICAIPNMLFLYNRLKLLAGRVEYEEYGLMDYTHVRWYTRSTLIRLFEDYGFLLDGFKANGNIPLGPLRSFLPYAAQSWLDQRMVAYFPGLLAWEFIFRFRTT